MSIRTLSVTYVENYEYTNKDLRALSRKQISLDLRVFGVKFQAKIFVRVKDLEVWGKFSDSNIRAFDVG